MHADAGLPLEPAEFEVVRDRHAGEQAAALRHVADAEARVLRGGSRAISTPSSMMLPVAGGAMPTTS